MINYFDRNLFQQVFNSNEFKGWLLSKHWFENKLLLSNLKFDVSINYFNIISEKILVTIIQVNTGSYEKQYFLPLIYYDKIQDILNAKESNRENIVKLTEITYSKMIAINVHDKQEQQILSLNLIEAEYCVYFWKKMLFDKRISESFPNRLLELTLYSDQFEDKDNMLKVQVLIEASLYPDRYDYSISHIEGGSPTNLLFDLLIFYKNKPDSEPVSYILKTYKEYSESLEPKTLFILVKNQFPNAPKIYGSIKLQGKEIIGILENIPSKGNIGVIYWDELNNMIFDTFHGIENNYPSLADRTTSSGIIKKYCPKSLEVSDIIGIQIKKLHNGLVSDENPLYSKEIVDSNEYLIDYTKKLNFLVENIQGKLARSNEEAFYTSPKVMSILIDIKDIIEKFRLDFPVEQIKIQPVHQNLHMQQIIYNKSNEHYNFYFIDFDGDPQLKVQERLRKFPIEKDLGTFLRSLSYIKFNTLLDFIEKKIIEKEKFEVPAEFLYSLYFRKSSKISVKYKILESVLDLLNQWENKLLKKIFKENLNLHFTLINYFTIEQALRDLDYELIFRPNNTLIPILGLKEIIDKY